MGSISPQWQTTPRVAVLMWNTLDLAFGISVRKRNRCASGIYMGIVIIYDFYGRGWGKGTTAHQIFINYDYNEAYTNEVFHFTS